jgi:hypothetical protein
MESGRVSGPRSTAPRGSRTLVTPSRASGPRRGGATPQASIQAPKVKPRPVVPTSLRGPIRSLDDARRRSPERSVRDVRKSGRGH